MTSGPQDPEQGGRGQQPPSGQPQYGTPQYGPPQYGLPQYGLPQYGQAPQGQPYGQPPEYGQPQYGQQNGQAYGQPSEYGQPPQYGQPQYGSYPAAPPGQGWGGALSAPTERPSTVKAGIGAFLANIVIGLIGLLIDLSDFGSYKADLAASTGLTADEVSTIATVTVAISLLIMAAFLAVLWFAWKGHNWARVVLWVLGGISVLFGAVGAAALTFLSAIGLLLVIAGIVLLALKPSNQWFRAEAQRRRRF
jgi:hypothetical protein